MCTLSCAPSHVHPLTRILSHAPSHAHGACIARVQVISAVCVTAIPDGEGRYIKDMPVFIITAVFSVLAYLWLIVILQLNSPNIVEVWEGVASFVFFPFLVYLAYLADQQVID